jgi:hypothetical protein
MNTKKAKKFPQVRVAEEDYNKLKKLAKVRGWSMSQVLSALINSNGEINNAR